MRIVESDLSLPMATKYSSQTPYGFTDGFPVLKISGVIRQAIKKTLAANKPKNMM